MAIQVKVKVKGSYDRTKSWLARLRYNKFLEKLERYGQEGVDALSIATPVDTGKTAASWDYEIHYEKGSVKIVWTNSNKNKGIPVAILIQYGHGTGTGGYVQGIDYINPALKPIFDKIAEEIWAEAVKV